MTANNSLNSLFAVLILLLGTSVHGMAQTAQRTSEKLSLDRFFEIVISEHPVARQGQLKREFGEAI